MSEPTPTSPADLTVGDLARWGARATRVLARHGIDFCCGGGRPLIEACRARGVDAAVVLAEVTAATAPEPDAEWTTAPLAAVIDHLVERYHRPLDDELPRLEALARKVARVHGDRDPERFAALLQRVLELADDLMPHMEKEERVLFPWILAGRGASAGAPVRVMEAEHEHVGTLLRQLRELTDDFTVPPEACGSWRALWEGLAELEADLHAHIHLENNVLFPRALRGE